jgi:hypothetical protein
LRIRSCSRGRGTRSRGRRTLSIRGCSSRCRGRGTCSGRHISGTTDFDFNYMRCPSCIRRIA